MHAVYSDGNDYFREGYGHTNAPPQQPPPLAVGGERRNSASSTRRKSVPGHERRRSSPLNDIDEHSAHQHAYPSPGPEYEQYGRSSGGSIQGTSPTEEYEKSLPRFNGRVTSMQSTDSRDLQTPSPELTLNLGHEEDPRFQEPLVSPSLRPPQMVHHTPIPLPQRAVISSGESNRSSRSSGFEMDNTRRASQSSVPTKLYPQLQYHHQQLVTQPPTNGSSPSANDMANDPYNGSLPSPSLSDGNRRHLDPASAAGHTRRGSSRPISTYSTLSADGRGRSPGSGGNGSPQQRALSASYDSRRSSFLDLTLPAHVVQRPVSYFDNSHLQAAVGQDLSLLSNSKTLEMYRTNAKKSHDPLLQYELAVFMIEIAQQQPAEPERPRPQRKSSSSSIPDSPHLETPGGNSRKELLREARQILERIVNRLPQAQYYLADAYASGLFNKGASENEKAFPLFIAASKHGHAESGYRAALCYEFGWGCRKDPSKAVQFFRQAASKNHPGAMTRLGVACLRSDLGLKGQYREGIKWLKRATDIADEQYPSAPYELGRLHEQGYGDEIFEDPTYAAQLYTQAAELGHTDAYFRMGEAYEHGVLNCPRDAALSVHFYTGAAQGGHPGAMMALCAWYLVGAEPVLEKNEDEAFLWAQKASETGMFDFYFFYCGSFSNIETTGLPKAEYAVGYFTEMGIGCRRDTLEANVWYVQAAAHGDERAKARIKIINEAAAGGSSNSNTARKKKSSGLLKKEPETGNSEKADQCCIM